MYKAELETESSNCKYVVKSYYCSMGYVPEKVTESSRIDKVEQKITYIQKLAWISKYCLI